MQITLIHLLLPVELRSERATLVNTPRETATDLETQNKDSHLSFTMANHGDQKFDVRGGDPMTTVKGTMGDRDLELFCSVVKHMTSKPEVDCKRLPPLIF